MSDMSDEMIRQLQQRYDADPKSVLGQIDFDGWSDFTPDQSVDEFEGSVYLSPGGRYKVVHGGTIYFLRTE